MKTSSIAGVTLSLMVARNISRQRKFINQPALTTFIFAYYCVSLPVQYRCRANSKCLFMALPDLAEYFWTFLFERPAYSFGSRQLVPLRIQEKHFREGKIRAELE